MYSENPDIQINIPPTSKCRSVTQNASDIEFDLSGSHKVPLDSPDFILMFNTTHTSMTLLGFFTRYETLKSE